MIISPSVQATSMAAEHPAASFLRCKRAVAPFLHPLPIERLFQRQISLWIELGRSDHHLRTRRTGKHVPQPRASAANDFGCPIRLGQDLQLGSYWCLVIDTPDRYHGQLAKRGFDLEGLAEHRPDRFKRAGDFFPPFLPERMFDMDFHQWHRPLPFRLGALTGAQG